jgi:hypothetical protein
VQMTATKTTGVSVGKAIALGITVHRLIKAETVTWWDTFIVREGRAHYRVKLKQDAAAASDLEQLSSIHRMTHIDLCGQLMRECRMIHSAQVFV